METANVLFQSVADASAYLKDAPIHVRALARVTIPAAIAALEETMMLCPDPDKCELLFNKIGDLERILASMNKQPPDDNASLLIETSAAAPVAAALHSANCG